ncbi:MAG: helical backbone metal receptor, partial [Candidatus Entotheonellia bacterium]
ATLRMLAQVTGAAEAAQPILARIAAAYRDTMALAARRPPVRVFCPIWKDPWMTINQDTFIHAMLTTCGGANIFAPRQRQFPLAADLGQAPPLEGARVEGRDRRYPRITLEEMAALMPEVILLPDEPYRFGEADRKDFARFPQVPAVRDRRIHVIDGKIVSWYWSRLDESLRALRELLLAGT